jgi:hypothetical protein
MRAFNTVGCSSDPGSASAIVWTRPSAQAAATSVAGSAAASSAARADGERIERAKSAAVARAISCSSVGAKEIMGCEVLFERPRHGCAV